MDRNVIEALKQYTDAQARIKCLVSSIRHLEDKIDKINSGNGIIADTVTLGKKGKQPLGVVKVTGFDYDGLELARQKLALKKSVLAKNSEDLLELMSRAEEAIDSMPSLELKNIFSFRYIDNRTWPLVADAMNQLNNGRTYTSESCRKKHDRYVNGQM